MSTKSKIVILEEELKRFEKSTPGVEATAVVSADGMIIASALPSGISEDKVAAMSAAFLSIAQKINEELNKGKFEMGLIKGDNGYVFVTEINPEALLVLLATKDTKIGYIFYEMRRLANSLSKILT